MLAVAVIYLGHCNDHILLLIMEQGGGWALMGLQVPHRHPFPIFPRQRAS